MDLSIIIVSYNEAHYIERAVNSCLKQDYKGTYEIIIGDDGSNDGSVDLIIELSRKHSQIRYFITEDRNDGVFIPSVRASNIIKKAMRISKGKYICVLSADDFYLAKDQFSNAISFLERDKKNIYSASFTDYARVYSDGRIEEYVLKTPSIRPLLIAKMYVHISGFVFRRQVINFLFDRWCSDVGLFYSICSCGRIKHIYDIGFGYFQRADSITHKENFLDFCILQILFLQDVFNKGKYLIPSLSRHYIELVTVFTNREQLKNEEYTRILINSQKYNHDFINAILKYNDSSLIKKIKILGILVTAWVSSKFFALYREIMIAVYKRWRNVD